MAAWVMELGSFHLAILPEFVTESMTGDFQPTSSTIIKIGLGRETTKSFRATCIMQSLTG